MSKQTTSLGQMITSLVEHSALHFQYG